MSMNPIIIPNNLVYKTIESYLIDINKSTISYSIKKENIYRILDEIDNSNTYVDSEFIKKNFIYFIYKYAISDDIEEPLDVRDGGRPWNGFEFLNNENNTGYGIFHCHLSNIDSSILIWYPVINEYGYYINLEY